MMWKLLWFVAFTLLAVIALAACGRAAGSGQHVIIEPLDTATPASFAAALAATPRSDATPEDPTAAGPTEVPSSARPEPDAASPTSVPTPAAPDRPTTGRWIEVNVTDYVVRLMDGNSVVQTIEPVAVGEQVDTGAYESTQTGLFHVYNKTPDLSYDPPYKTYISDWVGFDPAKANGFHSFLKDKDGKVVDPRTGRISNGCIRTGDPTAITDFAEIGMPVWVHA